MANPQTIIRDGSGAQSAAYQLPPGLFQYVESVLVQVDNTAGPDVRPTLSVQTVNGVVMAAKRQGEAIPAGDTGSATWALRLTDEADAASTEVELNLGVQFSMHGGLGDGILVDASASGNAAMVAGFGVVVVVSGTWTLPVGGDLGVVAFNPNGAAHQVAIVNANVQKIGATDREVLSGNAVTLAAGANAALPWNTRTFGTALLNLAVPTVPTVVGAGTYAVTVFVAIF